MSEGSPGRLTFEEIEELVAKLGEHTIDQLAKGPLPADKDDEHDCRVCVVLGRLVDVSEPAKALETWHGFFDETLALDAVTRGWRDHPGTEEERHQVRSALREWQEAAGTHSYARCCTIYFAARVELERRRRGYIEDGLDPDGEPPDDRDPGERRADEEAEDAERRLDAEKAGDLLPSYPPAVDQA